MKAQLESYFISFCFSGMPLLYKYTSKNADAEKETVSFVLNEFTPDVDTGSQYHSYSSVVAIIVIAISSLSRCPQGMYLLPSIISVHQPFQELGWWIQMAIAWPNGGSESGHLIIIAITNIINLLIRDVIMPSSCLLSLITSIITICRIWSWVNESRYEFL